MPAPRSRLDENASVNSNNRSRSLELSNKVFGHPAAPAILMSMDATASMFGWPARAEADFEAPTASFVALDVGHKLNEKDDRGRNPDRDSLRGSQLRVRSKTKPEPASSRNRARTRAAQPQSRPENPQF